MFAETPVIKTELGVEQSKGLVKIKYEPEKYETTAVMQSEHLNIEMELNLPDTLSVKKELYSDDDTYMEQPTCTPSITWHRPFKDSTYSTITCKEEPGETPNYKVQKVETTFIPMETKGNSATLNLNEDAALKFNYTTKGKNTCPMCHKHHVNKKQMQCHMLMHNGERLQCKICPRVFSQIAQLKKHQIVHLEDKYLKCEQCDRKFKTASNLQKHKCVHIAMKPFICEVCHRRFPIRGNLLKHQSKSCCKRPVDEPIVCNVCNKVFKKLFLLRSHLKKHTTDRPYSCDTCKRNFKNKSTLIRHFQLHNDNKPYSCKICKKNFTHPGLIKPHMRVHTGEKPYSCPICNKLFSHKHNMQRHTLTHEKVKRLVCDFCNKKFPKESHLRYHMRTHTKEKPFKCGVCTKTFSHKLNVLRHYTRKHPLDTYSCTDTDASVARTFWENVINKKIKPELGDVSSY